VWRGRVRCFPPRDDIIMWPLGKMAGSMPRTVQAAVDQTKGNGYRPEVDVTAAFDELARHGWAFAEPYDIHNPPQNVPCFTTPDGEDALLEAHQRERERKRKEAR
jgi:hypothetical protein